MKILHTSDLHLSSPLTSRLEPRLARIRRRELLSSFERLTDEAVRQGCSAFIIAGDLFDSEKITESARARVFDAIDAKPSLVFIYLPGNHEKSALLQGELPKNLHVLDSSEWCTLELGDTVFHARTSVGAGMFKDFKAADGKKNIAVLHGELRTSGADAIVISDIKDKGLDYIALGHYHTYSQITIDDKCTAVYCGTPEGRGFDEVGKLGYVIIDTNNTPVSHKFVPFAARTLHDISVDVSGISRTLDVEKKISEATVGVPDSDLCRIRLVGKYELEQKPDTAAIYDRLSKRFFHLDLKDETQLSICAEDFRYDKSLKGEFIRLVLADDSISDVERERIIEFGIRALMGETPDSEI